MGYALSWLAVRGKPRAAVLDALGLRATGTREEIAESPIVGAELPGGWFLVVTDSFGHRFISAPVLKRLSAECEVVTCAVEEHVMTSDAAGWKHGQWIWWVWHDSQRGIPHIETDGDLPTVYRGIHDRLSSEQQAAGGEKANVDYIMDIPVELARSITGFRHEYDIEGGGDEPFEVLAETSAIRSIMALWPYFTKKMFRD